MTEELQDIRSKFRRACGSLGGILDFNTETRMLECKTDNFILSIDENDVVYIEPKNMKLDFFDILPRDIKIGKEIICLKGDNAEVIIDRNRIWLSSYSTFNPKLQFIR